MVNRLISESARPRAPAAAGACATASRPSTGVMVVIPAMLTQPPAATASSRTSCELHYLANPERTRSSRCSPTGPTPTRAHLPPTTPLLDGAVARDRAR